MPCMDRLCLRKSIRLNGISGLLVLTLLLVGCDRGQNAPVPTQASIEGLATQIVLTENAPPPGWDKPIAFPEIDTGLREVSGWRYEVRMNFEGTFARTPRPTTASTYAQVWFNQLGSSRRVVVETTSELGGQLEESSYEAVRLGPDTFLVQDSACLSNADAAAAAAADLRAGTLVGGVAEAKPAARHEVINGQDVWLYDFTLEDLILPQVQPTETGQITVASHELWLAPEYGVIVRFWMQLDVDNVLLFGSTLPVTGHIIIRYDLYDIGVVPNITVPYGC